MIGRQSLAGVIVVTMLFAGCGSGTQTAPAPPVRQVTAEGFAAVVSNSSNFLLNVHTPDEGSISGTDAAVPFDQLDSRTSELPADRDALVAVYCMTARMSVVAAQTLSAMGYTNIVELTG